MGQQPGQLPVKKELVIKSFKGTILHYFLLFSIKKRIEFNHI